MEESIVRCSRCNQVLKREPYKSMGIGKVCAGYEGIVVPVTEKTKTTRVLIDCDVDEKAKKKKKIKRHYGASTPTKYNEFQLELNLNERSEK